MVPVHPIEAQSYRILQSRIDLSHLPQGSREVIARVIHATADLEYAESLVVDDACVTAGVNALRVGAPVICDVEMVRAGISGVDTCCYLEGARDATSELTRSAVSMRLAAREHPAGAIAVVGCAPTALMEILSLAKEGKFAPALVVGVPVGFVGSADAKEALRKSALYAISNVGEKGGSAVAAAIVNALVRMSRA